MAVDTHGLSPKGLLYNASAGAAAEQHFSSCPLDVIKTRFQVHGRIANANIKGSIIVGSLEQIFRKEGLCGMYRGLSPTMLALLPNWAVYFTISEQLKSFLVVNHQPPIGANMITTSGAGAATTVTTNLLWDVKTRLQTQGTRSWLVPYRSTLSTLRRITHKEGIRGLYKLWNCATVPAFAGVSHVAIQFPAYEKIKCLFGKGIKSKGVSGLKSYTISNVEYDVVRSRLQEQEQGHHSEKRYSGVVDCIKKVFQQEGIPGFYQGCATPICFAPHQLP
ncbi:nicotinamide adenine dinucleotide transporter 1, chloroplastic-like [Olea europaea subsp. europaea]|uniref:Nicotinamide adenine dinucleotide transporter 1, chloroplastic-like n=1 Tax=Olea europaea subsp. europaea TaxID=158383 RepID=A0A8S0R7W6_OLEEU|nr:nicotinamide adenine dinucleotide transporter 1, chloroplastic-like [Olea europaea subsp. europaea]